MEFGHPLRVITPTVDGDVIAVLARADAEFTPPQVAALARDWSEDGVRKSLARLVRQGIVLTRPAGRAVLYRLNRDHLATPAIIALATLRDTFLESLRAEIRRWRRPCLYAALFGSAARGDMGPESDIDVFVVRPDNIDPDDLTWRAQLDELSAKSTARTGNDTRVVEFSHGEAQAALRGGDRVVIDVAAQGIQLAGRPTYLRARPPRSA